MTQKLENSLCILWNAYCSQEDVPQAVKDFIQQNVVELSDEVVWQEIVITINKFKTEHKRSTGVQVNGWDCDILHVAHEYYRIGDINMFNKFLNQFVH